MTQNIIDIEQKEIVVCDWDGVVQYFHDEAVRKLAECESYLDLSHLTFEYVTTKMTDFYYDSSFKQEDRAEFKRLLDIAYFNNRNFYEESKFTKFSTALLAMSDAGFVQEIVILSHTDMSRTNINESKKEAFNMFIENSTFPNKFKLVLLDSSIPKHEWILANRPNFTTFIDDKPSTIYETAMVCGEGKTYLVPSYGYNTTSEWKNKFADALAKNDARIDISFCTI